MKTFTLASTILASATSVASHAIFQDLWVAGEDLAETCARFPASNSPVTNVQGTDIRCNAGPAAASGNCAMKAGDELAVEIHQQPHDRTCTNEAIGGNHFGPVLIYLSKVDSAASADGSGDWFKVAETGYDAATGAWGTDIMNADCGKYTFTLPAGVPSGEYLLRAEAIALHTASQPNGAQFYITCYQVTIDGTDGPVPVGVKLPGAYNAGDPGITVDIWGQNFNQYTIPGPPLATF